MATATGTLKLQGSDGSGGSASQAQRRQALRVELILLCLTSFFQAEIRCDGRDEHSRPRMGLRQFTV